MTPKCIFCNRNVIFDGGPDFTPSKTQYMCRCCGFVNLEEEARDDFIGHNFGKEDRNAISITIRNEWERRGRKRANVQLTLPDLEKIINQFRPLSPLEKLDNALIQFNKDAPFIGSTVEINDERDYPLFYCSEPDEYKAICRLLFNEGITNTSDPECPHYNVSITTKGYQRLREIQNPTKDSRKCFVAMWFSKEMQSVYEDAIKPAIEFVEKGEDSPRFESVKIDNVEHVNDINDEIIGQIRRSRFMVCDLTGYRGGVYFEAGFAYGLGLDIIYTCRKDWTKEEILKDKDGQDVKKLYDSNRKVTHIKKEGVHFDLAHRNRIEWTEDKLDDFKLKLENRIKAVIY